MTAETILTMADGRGIDLLNVTSDDICFATLAEHLAKEKRYNGATPGVEYSVAQHLCIGTDAILKKGATEEEAAYFHLHDVQEAIWKDDPTPKKRAIAERIADRCGVLATDIIAVFDGIVDEHDAAIHQAAGLPWPISPETARTVKMMDLVMFVTEWRDLMLDRPHPNWAPYSGLKPLDQKIEPWPWRIAADCWMSLAIDLLPSLRKLRV